MRQRERRVEVAREVVVSVAGPIRLGRVVPLAEVVDLRRVFVPRVPPQERAIGSEPLEVDVGVEHVGAVDRAARRAANPELVAKQVGSAVAEAAAHALPGSHAAEDELEAVGPLAGIEAFAESALDQAVGDVDHRVLAFGPELGHLVGALSGKNFFARLRDVARLFLRRRRHRGEGEQKRGSPEDRGEPGYGVPVIGHPQVTLSANLTRIDGAEPSRGSTRSVPDSHSAMATLW